MKTTTRCPPADRGGSDALVARGSQVAYAVQMILQGVNVAIVGPRHSGRSELLRAVRDGLEDAGRAARSVPAPWRWSSAGTRRTSSGEGLSEAIAFSELSELLTAPPSPSDVVLVDDIDDLDDDARLVVESYVRRSGVPVCSTRRPRRPGERSGHAAVEVPLPPLGFEDLHAVLEKRLGGPVSPEITARLLHHCGGLPGIVIPALESARAQGSLRRVAGMWTADHLWSPDLSGLYDPLLRSAEPGELDAAQLLACLGPVPLPIAVECVGTEVLESLEAQGLVRLVAAQGDHEVELVPAGLASYLTQQPRGLRATRILSQAQAVLGLRAPDEPAARRVASRLESCCTTTAADAPRAPASRWGDTTAAVDVLGQARRDAFPAALARWQETHHVADAVHLLSMSSPETQTTSFVDSVVAGTDTGTGHDTYDYVDFHLKAARWAVLRGTDPTSVIAGLQEAHGDDVRYRRSLWLLGYLLKVEREGLDAGYEDALGRFVGGSGADAATARVVLSACLTFAGRFTEAQRTLAVDQGSWPVVLVEAADLLAGFWALGRGDWSTALELGDTMLAAGTEHGSGYGCLSGCYVSALALAVRGRLDESRKQLLASLLVEGGWLGVLSPTRSLRTLRVMLSALTSHDDLASALAALVDQGGEGGEALPFSSQGLLRAVRLLIAGDAVGAVHAMDEDAERARRCGLVLSADSTEVVRTLLRAAREVPSTPGDGARTMGGEVLEAVVAAREAERAHDAGGLVRCARRFEALDLPGMAVRAYLTAAREFQQDGRRASADQVRSAVERLRGGEGLTGELASAFLLTPREQEIVDLVARGRSNAQIATGLFLSVRTVESHLRNIRRKTGATDRHDIVALLHGPEA